MRTSKLRMDVWLFDDDDGNTHAIFLGGNLKFPIRRTLFSCVTAVIRAKCLFRPSKEGAHLGAPPFSHGHLLLYEYRTSARQAEDSLDFISTPPRRVSLSRRQRSVGSSVMPSHPVFKLNPSLSALQKLIVFLDRCDERRPLVRRRLAHVRFRGRARISTCTPETKLIERFLQILGSVPSMGLPRDI